MGREREGEEGWIFGREKEREWKYEIGKRKGRELKKVGNWERKEKGEGKKV